MKRFVTLYLFFLLLLFGLFYADTSVLSRLLNEGQTELTLFLLNIMLEPGQLRGIDIWITPHYKIIINQACNGMIPVLFLFASLLAYPAGVRHKLLWMLIGYLSFVVVNVLRILIVVYVANMTGGGEHFYWSHDLLGNALLMLTGLLLFVAFIRTSRS